MSDERKIEIAREYVERQLQTMREHGSAPKEMSKQEYDSLVAQVADIVRT